MQFLKQFFGKTKALESSTLELNRISKAVQPAFLEFLELMHPCNNGRTTTPKSCEVALAFGAYHHWLLNVTTSTQFDPRAANETGRESACKYIAGVWSLDEVRKAVHKQRPDFDAARELRLADMRVPPNHDGWGDTVTRFVIMGCRTAAYATTREVGELEYIDPADDVQLLTLARDMMLQSLGQDAFRKLYPNCNGILDDY